jgi:hypothetical protein
MKSFIQLHKVQNLNKNIDTNLYVFTPNYETLDEERSQKRSKKNAKYKRK